MITFTFKSNPVRLPNLSVPIDWLFIDNDAVIDSINPLVLSNAVVDEKYTISINPKPVPFISVQNSLPSITRFFEAVKKYQDNSKVIDIKDYIPRFNPLVDTRESPSCLYQFSNQSSTLSISVTAQGGEVHEGSPITFIIKRAGSSNIETSVDFTITNPNSILADDSLNSVVFLPGEIMKVITFETNNNLIAHGSATVTLTLTASEDYNITTASADFIILEDDVPLLSSSIDETTLQEGDSATLTVEITNGIFFTTDQTISVGVSGTAASSLYSISDISLTLVAGTSSVTSTISAAVLNKVRAAKTIILQPTHDSANIGTPITINLPEISAVLSASLSAITVVEGDSSILTVEITNGVTFDADQTISIVISGTSQTADYSIGSTSLTLLAGTSSITTTITVSDDTISEASETVIIQASHNSVDIGTSLTITIPANDAPVFSFALSSATADEGDSITMTLSVTNSVTFATDQVIDLVYGGSAASSDYTAPASIILLAGETSITGTVSIVDDEVEEGAETLTIQASHNSVDIGAAQTITIAASDELTSMSDAIPSGTAFNDAFTHLQSVEGMHHIVQFITGTAAIQPYRDTLVGTTVDTYASSSWPNIIMNRWRISSPGLNRRLTLNRSGSGSWLNDWINDSDLDDTSFFLVNYTDGYYIKVDQDDMASTNNQRVRVDIPAADAIEFPTTILTSEFTDASVSSKNFFFLIARSDYAPLESS